MPLRRYAIPLAIAVCLFVLCDRAYALAFEYFGNDPVPAGYNFGRDVLEVANLKSRFYWYEVNGNPFFYCRGDTTAFNLALQKFAALAGPRREVILLPGPAERTSLLGEQRFAYDWVIHTPAGARPGPGVPTMTVYLRPSAFDKLADTAAVTRWIADLDSDTFATRDRAIKELEKVADAAAPALRKARTASPSAQARRALDHLVDDLEGVDLRLVEVPADVTVLHVNDLLDRSHANLKSDNGKTRARAITELELVADYVDIVPDLVGVLTAEKDEYVRRCVAGVLYRLGKRGTPALPLLKAGLKDPDVNVRNAFDQAIRQIEAAKEAKPARDPAKIRAALEGIAAFCKTLPAESRN